MAVNIDALKWAVELGGPSQRAFAEELAQWSGQQVSQQTVSHWVRTGEVPLRWFIHIERMTGIPCHELDPDYFPALSQEQKRSDSSIAQTTGENDAAR